MVQRSKKPKKIKTRMTSKMLLLSQSRVWKGQPDQYQDTTIETTEVGFAFAARKIWIPHAEFPQGISVNVVSIESTPFLIGLDVIREYRLVID